MNRFESVPKPQTHRRPLGDKSNFILTTRAKKKTFKKVEFTERFIKKSIFKSTDRQSFVPKDLKVCLNGLTDISGIKTDFPTKDLKVYLDRIPDLSVINDTKSEINIPNIDHKGRKGEKLAGINSFSKCIKEPKGRGKKKKQTTTVRSTKIVEAVESKNIIPSQLFKKAAASDCDNAVFSVSVDSDSDSEVIFNYSSDNFEKINNKSSQNMQSIDEEHAIKKRKNMVAVPEGVNKNLRKLPPKNYAEQTLFYNSKTDSIIKPIRNAIPVYRQMLPVTKKPVNDEYEFNDFSPETKIGKKRKLKRSSYFFEKETHEVLKNLEKKDLLQKRQIQRKAVHKRKQSKNQKTYDAKIKKLITNLIPNIKNKQTELVVTQPKIISTIPKIITTAEVHTADANKQNHLECGNGPVLGSIQEKEESTNLQHLCNGSNLGDDNKSEVEFNVSQDGNISDYDDAQDVESCFGFCEDHQISNERFHNGKINILSSVLVNPGKQIDSPGSFRYEPPNANSTMLPEQFMKQPGSPWRFDFNVKINPHFLRLKKNALPQLEQDIIIDHSLAEEFESSCAKTPNKCVTSRSKSPVQKSLFDYIDTNLEKENIPVENSLYDYNKFVSPTKNKTKPTERLQTFKKNILTIKNNNLLNSNRSESPDDNNITYFGFDESADKFLNEQSIWKDLSAKPSRFDMSAIRKYARKNKILKDTTVLPETTEDIPDEEPENCGSFEVHLFEDPEGILDNMPSEIGKRQKRKRDNSETNNERKEQKRHRKTKFEIEQEKWIETFNKEVEEIEKCQLECD